MAKLFHYGTKRHSGRYPYGSGENPYQHENSFLASIKDLRAQGLSNTEIAKHFGISTGELRSRITVANEEIKALQRADIIDLKSRGYSNVAIAEKVFGDPSKESKVRYILKPSVEAKAQVTQNITDVLKENVDANKYIDVGSGAELYLGVSREKLNAAISKLKDEGYEIRYLEVPQVGVPGKYTSMKVLCPPGTEWKEVNEHKDEISLIGHTYTPDGGKTFLGIEKPKSLDSSRLMVRYTKDGGSDMDGVIQLRRGIEDISLGSANYAQVRIAVDGTHYIKGMAVYSDDMPDGVDVIFNTNKHEGTPVLGDKKNSVLKPMKTDKETGEIDWDNPFGTTLRMDEGQIVGQRHYIDDNGKSQLSAINIVRQEGDWNKWSNTLASQFLAKQPIPLIKQQLNKTYDDKAAEYERILQVSQPEVKKKLLISFADDCDSSASELKAAALPRQSSKVILPVTDISEKEIYAPTYRDGEQVALVRYPHGGIFEIPVLTVNNKNKTAQKIITKDSIDAVGINPKTAQQLSGADFDGDTVIVIPTKNQKIKASSPLAGLKDFDPKESYPAVEGMKVMTKRNTQTEMGKISNLITDMTAKGASDDELVRAVKHSMVVIDAEKHHLNYKLSEEKNGIAELKEKYQGGKDKGASTLFSRANSDARVDLRKTQTKIDPDTGEKIYETDEANLYYMKPKTNKKGETTWVQTKRLSKTTKMAEVSDAHELSSGTIQEEVYADYANSLKAMANNARKEAISILPTKVNKSAKDTYTEEVASLNAKLNIALKNAPKERKAQILANQTIQAKRKSNPDMTEDDLKKYKTQALAAARSTVGAGKKAVSINITDKEWEAINSGALSSNKISQIIANSSEERIKQLSMPKSDRGLSNAQKSRIKTLEVNGYTIGEIADSLGVSTTTVSNVLIGKE